MSGTASLAPRRRARLEGRVMILGCGAQKAGSTWMFDHLARNPAVRRSPVKEMNFFTAWLRPARFGFHERRFAAQLAAADGAGMDEAARARLAARVEMSGDRAAYLRWFARRGLKRSHMMEMTPCYALLSEEELRFARAHFEAAGVIVRPLLLLRDPVARIVSHHRSARETFGQGYNSDRGLLLSLAGGEQIRRSRYDLTLARLFRVFGEEAVTVCFFERLFDPADPHLAEVERALGLSPLPPLLERRINASPEAAAPPQALLAALRRRLRPAYRFVSEHYGPAAPAAWNF